MQKSGGRTPATRLRQSGVRVSSGPWVVCAAGAAANRGHLIVALGRTAGQAVTRSRVRRIAREVFRASISHEGAALDLLLFVRKEVSGQPRRRVRKDLAVLLARVPAALRRRDGRATQDAVVRKSDASPA